MSIKVTCPNGHTLQVKEKYAGKSGLCPHCQGRVEVPNVLTDDHVLDFIGHWQPPAAEPKPSLATDDDPASVLHDGPSTQVRPESGMSLLASAVIRHRKICTHCGERVELRYASCPKCKKFFDD